MVSCSMRTCSTTWKYSSGNYKWHRMVYLHFPVNLTEEEIMLQAKYQKLKKKKKALQALKAPKQEPEKPVLPKRPTEARDAREIARKLIKSGAIQAIKTPPTQPQNATFKRPRAGRERKISGGVPGTTGGVASYQPFSASQEPPPPEDKQTPRVKYLYDSFVTSVKEEPKATKSVGAPVVEAPPQPKPSVLQITGSQITEEVLRRRLVSFEPFSFNQENEEKVYLIFEVPEAAARAMTMLDGNEEGWRVALMRKAPIPPAGWRQNRTSAPPPPKDLKRTMVTYDDIFD